ncbi:MAG: hypothetical protein ACRD8W_19705 [Nitrososphaeraceae archaeon]|jgi:hypothetical protein
MIIKEIKNLTHKEFDELSNIYLSTFPLENAKHLDIYLNHIFDMLKNDSRYHLYVAIKDITSKRSSVILSEFKFLPLKA